MYDDDENNATRKEMGMRLTQIETNLLQDMFPRLSDPDSSGTFIEQTGQILEPISFQLVLKAVINNARGNFF